MEEKRERVHERKTTATEEAPTTAETTTTEGAPPKQTPVERENSLKIEVHATATHHKRLEPVVAHAQTHDLSHNQQVIQYVNKDRA